MTDMTFITKGKINDYILGIIGNILKHEGIATYPCTKTDCILVDEKANTVNEIERDGIILEYLYTAEFSGVLVPHGMYAVYQLSGYSTQR